MALHDVAAEPSAEGEGSFQVNGRAGPEVSEVGAAGGVSGMTSKEMQPSSNSVMVRQAPLTEMLSPMRESSSTVDAEMESAGTLHGAGLAELFDYASKQWSSLSSYSATF